MANPSLITLPDERLRKPSKPINEKEIGSPSFKGYCDDLVRAMNRFEGVGIAGVQVGDLRCIAVVQAEDGPIVIINPKIRSRSRKRDSMEEGCLSVPKHFGSVTRAHKIEVEYTTREGLRVRKKVIGFVARIFQHEIDHMDGTLFIDRAEKVYVTT